MAGGVVTENKFGGGRSFDAEGLGTDGHASIRADPGGGVRAPDKRPPRAARDGTQDIAFVLLGQVPSLLWFHLKFSVNFVLVSMKAQVLDMAVGLIDVGDFFTGEVSG